MPITKAQRQTLSEYNYAKDESYAFVVVARHQDDERYVVVDVRQGKERIIKRFPNGELSWNKAQRLADDEYWKATREENFNQSNAFEADSYWAERFGEIVEGAR